MEELSLPDDVPADQRDEIEVLATIFDTMEVGTAEGGEEGVEVTLHISPEGPIDIEFSFGHEDMVERHTLESLPPFVLRVLMPRGYPEAAGARFTLEAPFLPDGVTHRIAEALAEAAVDYAGGPVVFAWAEYLRHEALPALGFADTLPLHSLFGGSRVEADGARLASADPRVQPNGLSEPRVVEACLDWGRRAEVRAFLDGTHECEVCLEDVPGTACTRLDCGHFVCTPCGAAHVRHEVRSGRAVDVSCPHGGCRVPVPDAVVRELLGDGAAELLERMQLQAALRAMGDVAHCPQCGTPSVRENKLCLCSKCSFAFCADCGDAHHPGRECSGAAQKLRELDARLGGRELSAEQRAARKRLEAEAASAQLLAKTTRQCPTCGIAIFKTTGCNKIVCSSCKGVMCWMCNRSIRGYDHFGGRSCPLFEQREVERFEQEFAVQVNVFRAAMGLAPLELTDGSRCPQCNRHNPRTAGNNHQRCYSCKTSYCHACHRVVVNFPSHYNRATGCRQHG